MVDVFISYARESHDVARRIAGAVADEGYSVWWDEDLPPHLSYGDVITEKIGAARAVIVIWSPAAAESEWVRAEADLARGQKKLIQTSIDGRLPPMPFNQIQFATIGDWQGEPNHPGWRKVKASLAALCGGGQTAAAGASPAPFGSSQPPTSITTPAAARPVGARWWPVALAGAAILLAAAAGGWLLVRDGGETEGEDGNRPMAAAERELSADEPPAAAMGAANPSTARFTQAATIDDPDGYTNVRSGPSESFPVIARIGEGDVFTTYPQTSDWWQVRTADSRVGFLAASRIRVIDATASARDAEAPAADIAQSGPAESGPAPVEAIPAAVDPRQIFPNSSSRRLRPADLAGLSPAQLRLARNEIFARHGRPFRDPALRRHFQRYSWYVPQPGPVTLNGVEQANVALLQRAETK